MGPAQQKPVFEASNPPENYPVSACPNLPTAPDGRHPGATYVVPVQQTFGWMGAAVEFTVHNVRARIWNKGMMDAYLRTCAIPTSVREHVWRQCRPATFSEKSAEIEQTSVLLKAIGIDS